MLKALWQDKSKRWIVTVAAAIGVLAIVTVGAVAGKSSADPVAGGSPFFEVAQGPLVINVSVSGTIKASEMAILKSEVEGQNSILWIVPEGTVVEQGDLLVELDSAAMQDEVVEQEIRVRNAEAAFITARENLEVVKNQAKSDVDQATLDLKFAQEDLRKFIEGDYPTQLMESDARITLAQSDHSRAKEALKWSEELFEKDFISSTELEADRQSAQRAELDLQLAMANKDLLVEYEQTRQLDQLESDVRQAEMALERVQRKASADVIQAEADFGAKDMEFKQQQDRLAKDREQLEKTKIYAPTRGLVVYATTGQGSWRGNEEPLKEGQSVRERQELIHLPTADSFIAEVEVHESSLAKIRPGMPVQVTVDAVPGRQYQGVVETIAPLPDAQSIWLNPDLKVYSTKVNIAGDTTGLRTGMSCRGEIIVERHDSAMYVPVQAVVRVSGQPTVYLPTRDGLEARPVEIGLDNNRMVVILSGLEPGERVVLDPPLAPASMEDGQNLLLTDSPAQPDAAEPAAGDAAPAGGEKAPDAPGGNLERPAGPDGEAGGGDDDAARQQRREEMRRRFENMSEEEREQMRQQWQQRQGGGGGRGGEAGQGGGGRGPGGGFGGGAGGNAS